VFTTTNLFTANQTWNRHHRLNVIAGSEFENRWTAFNHIEVRNFGNNLKPVVSMGAEVYNWTGGGTGRSQFSLLSSADYSYRLRYYVSASYRIDASSRFHPDHRFGNFWSVSGAYRVSNTPWFRDLVSRDLINNLRIRASYGENGALPSQLYHWRDGYTAGVYANNPSVAQTYRPTENLTWEKNRIWNIGIDARMFNDRIRFSAEYYDRKSRDLLQDVRISGTSGFRTMLMNTNAGIHNTGFEFDVRAIALNRGKHSLTTGFNLAAGKSIWYGLEVNERDGYNRQVRANGRNVHSWYTVEIDGIDPVTGLVLYVYLDEHGNRQTSISSANSPARVLGQGLPKVSGSYTMEYGYGPWSLSVMCTYGLGHHIFDRIAMRNANLWANDFAISMEQYNRWTPDNPYAATPLRVRNSSTPSNTTQFLFKGDYLKVRNIRLQYSLPEKTASAMRMSTASVFVQAENPFIFSHIAGGYDPELSLDGYRHIGTYPTVSTFTAGVIINF